MEEWKGEGVAGDEGEDEVEGPCNAKAEEGVPRQSAALRPLVRPRWVIQRGRDQSWSPGGGRRSPAPHQRRVQPAAAHRLRPAETSTLPHLSVLPSIDTNAAAVDIVDY
jgi:hypothetical protein